MNILFTTFITVFIAELGDKTQLATLLFASNKNTSKLLVFLGASLALISTSLIAVLVGSYISNFIDEKTLKIIAGIGFIGVGIWTLFSK